MNALQAIQALNALLLLSRNAVSTATEISAALDKAQRENRDVTLQEVNKFQEQADAAQKDLEETVKQFLNKKES